MKINTQLKKCLANIKICLIFVITLTLITYCSIGDCDIDTNTTQYFPDDYKFAYKQGDTLMFVTTKLDTFFYIITVKHDFDTTFFDASGYCDEYYKAYEYYLYTLKIISQARNKKIGLDSTYINIHAYKDKTYMAYRTSIINPVFYRDIIDIKLKDTLIFKIQKEQFKIISYVIKGKSFWNNDVLIHDYYGFLGFIVDGKDSLLLMDAPFYNEIIENKIITKQ